MDFLAVRVSHNGVRIVCHPRLTADRGAPLALDNALDNSHPRHVQISWPLSHMWNITRLASKRLGAGLAL